MHPIDGKLSTINEAKSIERELKEAKIGLEALSKSLQEKKGEMTALRKANEIAVRDFSELFSDVIHAVMGGQVKAFVLLGEKGISPKIERNGDLYGAALETIKVLAFDIAALVSGIEGKSHHPRFLLHDAPREADMSRVIYERFFLYARKLENAYTDSSKIAFQYLITTTTAPPPDMQEGSRWMLRPILNASDAQTRLLKVDL